MTSLRLQTPILIAVLQEATLQEYVLRAFRLSHLMSLGGVLARNAEPLPEQAEPEADIVLNTADDRALMNREAKRREAGHSPSAAPA
jgi:hypothetical protein